MVDCVCLHLVAHFACVFHGLGIVIEQRVHFLARFEPFLFGVDKSVAVVEVFAGGKAYQPVVRLCVFCVDKVHVVGADEFYSEFFREFHKLFVHFLLRGIGFAVGEYLGIGYFVALQFKVIVFAEKVLVPQCGLFGIGQASRAYLARHFACQTGGADNETLVILFEVCAVGSRAHVKAVGPCS